MKTFLFLIAAIILPMVFLSLFCRYFVRQWDRMDASDIALCKEFGFPNFGSNLNDAMRLFLTGKAYIWYPLFVTSALLFLLSFRIGRAAFYISNAILCILAFSQYYALFRAKAALHKIKKPVDRSFFPVVRMFRASFAYSVILFVIFNLFFDLIMF